MSRQTGIWVLMILGLLLLLAASMALGSVSISWEDWKLILTGNDAGIASSIVGELRLPRSLAAIAAGAGLGIGGLLMQTLFRNPLAGPGILGITSGAGLGVAAVMLSGAGMATISALRSIDVGAAWTLLVAASLGAGLVMMVILVLSWRIKDPVVLLIVGVMVGQLTLAIVSIWQYVSQPEEIREYLLWSFGSFSGVTPYQAWMLIAVTSIGSLITVFMAKTWNLLLLGETYARSLGLSVQRARIILITITSILTGAITAFCGPIGFIGVAVPHLARGVTGSSSHRILVPATIICGAGLMLFCDVLSRLPGSSGSIPLNAVTILIGAPVVIGVLLRRSKYRGMW